METVEALWQRIESWLQNHAPHSWQRLAPGASELAIQQAEEELGVQLPEDFKASWHLHNGGFTIFLVTKMEVFSLQEILTE